MNAPAPLPSPSLFKMSPRLIIAPRIGGKASASRRRFFNALVALAQTTETPAGGGGYAAKAARLSALAGNPSRSLAPLRRASEDLMKTWVDLGDGKQTPLLESAGCVSTGGGAIFSWRFHPRIDREIHSCVDTVDIDLEVQSCLTSHSSAILYEFAAMCAASESSQSLRLPWREWASLLTGSPAESATLERPSYAEFKYFRRGVLTPAVEKVNAVSPFRAEMFDVREGQQVSELMLMVTAAPSSLSGTP